MSTATAQTATSNTFVIQAPAIMPGNNVLDAVHALYYLPENYKLVFTASAPQDQALYNEVVSLVERDALGERVQFTKDTKSLENARPNAVIVSEAAQTARQDRQVSGDSPEALASAILDVARAAA
jgi:hypothetical protein